MLTEAQIKGAPQVDYMNESQLRFFHELLLCRRDEIIDRIRESKAYLSTNERSNDELDRAIGEEETRYRLRIVERESRLLRKIDSAIVRIKDKDYGYCEISGEPIGIPRLLIRPTATLCAEEKMRQEKIERNYAERD